MDLDFFFFLIHHLIHLLVSRGGLKEVKLIFTTRFPGTKRRMLRHVNSKTCVMYEGSGEEEVNKHR